MSVKIQFKKLHPDASVPEKATPGSAGWDVRALESGGIGVGETVLVRTGIAVAIPMGYEIQTRPRSGLAVKKGITLLNSPATIDSDYRGELFIPLTNLGKNGFSFGAGYRVAQIVLSRVPEGEFVEVDELPSTVRGDGGFGHTGVE